MATSSIDSTITSSEVLFGTRLQRTQQDVLSSTTTSRDTGENADAEAPSVEDGIVLCLIWRSGKIGAAYFNFAEKLLYIYEEHIDPPPQFLVTRSMYRQIQPKYILTMGRKIDDYVKLLIGLIDDGDEDSTNNTSAGEPTNLPPNMFLLSMKDYHYDECRSVLSSTEIASGVLEKTDLEREMYLHSLINFDYKLSVNALGALVKYLNKNWVHFMATKDELKFLHIHQVSMEDHLLMDGTSFNALQIFHQFSHSANFKRGLPSSMHEGFSIFKLFASQCKSKMGITSLKNIMLNPVNNMDELNMRLDFIYFVLHPHNQHFVESLQDNIKKLSDINWILFKIQHLKANAKEWHILYNTIYHITFMNDLCAPYADQCKMLKLLRNSITKDLLHLEPTIAGAIDFDRTNIIGRPIIKMGLDAELDAKKLRREDMSKHLAVAATISANQLPNYLDQCTIVYLPEVGHMIAIKEWEPGCDPEDLQYLDFQFKFTLRGVIHYKNPLCLELDNCLGDIPAQIIAHENRILHRLSGFVLKYNKDIRNPLRIISIIDALISIAHISYQNNYVRPTLNDENFHEIDESRHPLLELSNTVQSNSFYSGRNSSRMKIITGPNGSGKSMYLIQVGLVVYLAHIGSYVPAKSANIGMMHSIHTRMQSTESASVRLSAFMMDISQMSHALYCAKANSLVLVDEFGKGTSSQDGFVLLTHGVLKEFLDRDATVGCPHVLVATHFHSISNYLPASHLVDYWKTVFNVESGTLQFMYKIEPGESGSFAFEACAVADIPSVFIQRSREMYECMKTNQPINALSNISKCNVQSPEELEAILMKFEHPPPDADSSQHSQPE